MFPLIPLDHQMGAFGDYGLPYHGLFTLIHQDPFAVEQDVITTDRSFLKTNNKGVIVGDPLYGGMGIDPAGPPAGHNRKFPNTAHSRIFKIPGHTYTRDPIHQERDEFLGLEYRDDTVINGTRIGGFNNSVFQLGWLYVDSLGTRWNINISSITISKPDYIVWLVTVKRYGRICFPNSFYGIENVPNPEEDTHVYRAEGSAGVTDFASLSDSPVATAQLIDVNSTGAKALFGVGGGSGGQLYQNFDPVNLASVFNQRKAIVTVDQAFTGPHMIYEVTLSGSPDTGDFGFSFAVFRDQAACGGNIATNTRTTDDPFEYWSGTYVVNCEVTGGTFLRPLLTTPCIGGAHSAAPVGMGGVSILGAASLEDDLRSCGWERLLCDGSSILGNPHNEFNSFKWWVFDRATTTVANGDEWAASREYIATERVNFAGITFTAEFAHTSDELFEPGIGTLWVTKWQVLFNAHDAPVGDINAWAQGTSYGKHDAVHIGGADYYISKGIFSSFDGDPESTNHDEPGVGDNWEAFWDGPHNVLLGGAVWLPDKLINKDWIVAQSYSEPAIQQDPILADATWKCLQTHVSSPSNKPGVGARWAQYWIQEFTSSGGSQWEAPIVHEVDARVHLDIAPGPTVDDRTYKATVKHTATLDNIPPDTGFWEEVTDVPDCFHSSIGSLSAALNSSAYHVQHIPKDDFIDWHIKNITVTAHYKANDTIKLYECDVHYQRDLKDKILDHCWDTGCRPELPDPFDSNCALDDGDVQSFSGTITRGKSTVTETFTYDFRAGGSIRSSIFFRAIASGEGSDVWTERFSKYPDTWFATGTRTLTFQWDAIQTVNVNETITQDDTLWAGKTGDDVKANNKSAWPLNDFANGETFRWINEPYMDRIRATFEPRMDKDFPGATLTGFTGTTVALDAISTVEQYEAPRPNRTFEDILYGRPFPTLRTVFYSDKLVGPLVYGKKSNSGIALDSQYLRVLEPDDMEWKQYGVFGPDAEASSVVTMTHTSPINDRFNWLTNADYGDDIACAYDPINKIIHRNSQYRVVYI